MSPIDGACDEALYRLRCSINSSCITHAIAIQEGFHELRVKRLKAVFAEQKREWPTSYDNVKLNHLKPTVRTES